MKSLAIIAIVQLSLASASLLDVRAACHADNCLRALTGTAHGLAAKSTRLAECKSYLLTTVIPTSAVTVTVATSYVFIGNTGTTPAGTQATPPITVTAGGLPRFATSACTPNSGNTTPAEIRLSSACSCAGVTPSTTEFLTFSATATATATSFSVSAIASGGLSGYLAKDAQSATLVRAFITAGPKGHLILRLVDGTLFIVGDGLDNFVALQLPLETSYPVDFMVPGTFPPGNEVHWVIQSDLQLTGVTKNGNSVLQSCAGELDLSASEGGVDFFGRACTPVKLVAVPLP